MAAPSRWPSNPVAEQALIERGGGGDVARLRGGKRLCEAAVGNTRSPAMRDTFLEQEEAPTDDAMQAMEAGAGGR